MKNLPSLCSSFSQLNAFANDITDAKASAVQAHSRLDALGSRVGHSSVPMSPTSAGMTSTAAMIAAQKAAAEMNEKYVIAHIYLLYVCSCSPLLIRLSHSFTHSLTHSSSFVLSFLLLLLPLLPTSDSTLLKPA